MIRFINLTGQIFIDDEWVHFAWYDTIKDEFMEFNDSQDWHTWEEFEQDLKIWLRTWTTPLAGKASPSTGKEMITRFKRLYPPRVLFMEGYEKLKEI